MTGLPLSVISDRSFLKLYRLRSVYVLKTSLSVTPLQSRLLSVGREKWVTWSGHVLLCGDVYGVVP